MAKILFQNGMVVDGTGAKPYQADVLVEGDRIVKIGKVTPDPSMEVIDAAGLAVAPASSTPTATVTCRSWWIRK